MRTIITGSAGFIGFHLTKYLLQKGYDVVGIDNFNSYYETSLKYARNDELQKISLETEGNFILKNCDIEDYEINFFRITGILSRWYAIIIATTHLKS